jgi:UDP-3-O-[3-hydroxymyristoyl] glucosamine N-acyltransferase
MQFSAGQIAALLSGTVEGNDDITVSGLSKIEQGSPGTLTFLANPKYAPYIYSTAASIAIVSHDFVAEQALPASLTLVRVADAYQSFAQLLAVYDKMRQPKAGISEKTHVADSAKIGDGCYLGPFSYIGSDAVLGEGVKVYPGCFIGDGVSIGSHSVLFAGVKVYADCSIGAHCTLHSGVVVGGDGFGFAPNSENNYQKVPQIGNVIIEDHVEVGSNTTIDRATLGSTIIRRGVKLDNLIQVAHNVEVGENTVIAAQTGIAGSTIIGKNCMIGGQVGIIGHLSIADGTKIAAQSGIGQDIREENTVWQGSPAFAIMDYKKSYVGFRKLPEWMQRLETLEKELQALKADKNKD